MNRAHRLFFKAIAILLALCMMILFSSLLFAQNIAASELIIKFYPLGSSGDSFIIDYGDFEILVDAGATQNSANTIIENMEAYCDDGVWEMIIVTHRDSDHIAAFSFGNAQGVLGKFKQTPYDENGWELKYFIDFDVSNDETVKYFSSDGFDVTEQRKSEMFTTTTYKRYAEARDKVVAASNAEYYTASQCCWKQRGVEQFENATNKFTLSNSSGNSNAPTLTILYNYFYDHLLKPDNKIGSVDINNLSVCFMIEYQNERFLFTGDLQEQYYVGQNSGYVSCGGETKLIENNPILKEGVTFYKAAHHGSKSSSSKNFIDNIRPEYVVISVVADEDLKHSDENSDTVEEATEAIYSNQDENEEDDKTSKPTETVLNNFFKYTDKIYITEKMNENSAENYYGNITLKYSDNGIAVETQELDAMPIHHTEWFKENRTSKLNTFVFDLPDGSIGNWHCTLVKYGSVDILIDCGIYNDKSADKSVGFVDKIKNYCVDGVLDYVIVTHAQSESISQIIGQHNKNNGVFDSFEIEHLIDFGNNTNMDAEKDGELSWYKDYVEKREKYIKNNKIKRYNDSTYYQIEKNFSIEIFNKEAAILKNEDDYSLCTLITFYGEKLLFTGDLVDESRLINSAGKGKISNVTFFLSGGNGAFESNSMRMLSTIKPKFTVIPAVAGLYQNGDMYPSIKTCNTLMRYASVFEDDPSKLIYLMGEYSSNEYNRITGDITFALSLKAGKIVKRSLVGSKAQPILEETDWYKNNVE